MPFDVRSLLVAVILTNIFCAGARLLLWRMHSTLPGLGRWALAGAAGALALFFLLFYGLKHWTPSLALAQVFVVLGLMLAWDGFRRFTGRTPVSLQLIIMVALLVLTWVTLAHFLDSLQFRAIGNSIFVVILSALIARDLLISSKPIPIAMRATGWAYALNALVFLLRILASTQDTTAAGPLNPDGFAVFMLLWWLCMTIAITLGMVLMTSERLQADLDTQANHDPLTGALNRRSFSLMAEKEISRARRYASPISVLMMDLDYFKLINDKLGHDTGDVMLCRFVTITSQILRDEDIFCRYGGEEFVAVLPDTNAEQALIAAERIRNAFMTDSTFMDLQTNSTPFPITVSIGIAEREQNEDFESLLQRADTALYTAKSKGRNCCELAEPL